jgi:hypothetical protein
MAKPRAVPSRQRMHLNFTPLRITHMTGLLILLAVLALPYLALNVRRLIQGRSWAFTFCQAAKEWEEGERAKRLAAKAAAMQPAARKNPPLDSASVRRS